MSSECTHCITADDGEEDRGGVERHGSFYPQGRVAGALAGADGPACTIAAVRPGDTPGTNLEPLSWAPRGRPAETAGGPS